MIGHSIRSFILLCTALLCSAGAQQPAANTSNGHWIALFDGSTLFGWHATSDADWSVQEGAITVTRGEPGFLMTNSQFGDFELELEFAAPAKTNSGVFLRSAAEPQDPEADCLEINIAADSHPFPNGSIVARQRANHTPANDDTWRSMSIRAAGNRFQVSIAGEQVVSYQGTAPSRGHLGLQFNAGGVRFRNIRLRPLNMRSLFNGRDLTGWRTHPQMKGEFTVEDRDLRVRGGSGQLETTASFEDFVLQLECKTHADNLNSGIFFRCIPEDRMMGYESQIHNGFAGGDRSQPTDFGTGGIFRRQPARRVVANDRQWFRKTIIATDNHFAVWVNGYQVADWIDQRPAHANPRQGSRREAGTIIIQAHDPTTDLSFRGLRIATTSVSHSEAYRGPTSAEQDGRSERNANEEGKKLGSEEINKRPDESSS